MAPPVGNFFAAPSKFYRLELVNGLLSLIVEFRGGGKGRTTNGSPTWPALPAGTGGDPSTRLTVGVTPGDQEGEATTAAQRRKQYHRHTTKDPNTLAVPAFGSRALRSDTVRLRHRRGDRGEAGGRLHLPSRRGPAPPTGAADVVSGPRLSAGGPNTLSGQGPGPLPSPTRAPPGAGEEERGRRLEQDSVEDGDAREH